MTPNITTSTKLNVVLHMNMRVISKAIYSQINEAFDLINYVSIQFPVPLYLLTVVVVLTNPYGILMT